MFEKEAEEYLNKTYNDVMIRNKNTVIKAFKDGAEYGYNKALEEATHNYNAIIADYDKVYNDNLDYSYHIEGQLTKAKDIIKELVKGVRITFDHKGFITDVDAFVSKAEQFLSEVEK